MVKSKYLLQTTPLVNVNLTTNIYPAAGWLLYHRETCKSVKRAYLQTWFPLPECRRVPIHHNISLV